MSNKSGVDKASQLHNGSPTSRLKTFLNIVSIQICSYKCLHLQVIAVIYKHLQNSKKLVWSGNYYKRFKKKTNHYSLAQAVNNNNDNNNNCTGTADIAAPWPSY
jgi:hypothetical protein